MHIVIDEGQDFGIDAVEETGIIEVLKSIITDIKPNNASFYIFMINCNWCSREKSRNT